MHEVVVMAVSAAVMAATMTFRMTSQTLFFFIRAPSRPPPLGGGVLYAAEGIAGVKVLIFHFSLFIFHFQGMETIPFLGLSLGS